MISPAGIAGKPGEEKFFTGFSRSIIVGGRDGQDGVRRPRGWRATG
jgi:hypothetical protein